MSIAVITGASSGIGREFLHQICQANPVYDEIWILSRSADKLAELRESLDNHKIVPLAVDLASREGRETFYALLSEKQPEIGLLIQCAGLGIIGEAETLTPADIRSMIDLNCTALTEITTTAILYMRPLAARAKRGQGPRIIHMASSAGFLSQPGFSVYAATKSYVINYSRALHRELLSRNIRVTVVCPGPVSTEFMAKAAGTEGYTHQGIKSLFIVQPEGLVNKSLLASEKGRSLYTYSLPQKSLRLAAKLLPHRLLIWLSAKSVSK